ncbi:type I restriction modification DNA specificity domain protein [Actinomyces sp. ICM39]|uniref:restriction endonuclease subunit S n=1 Tax=Actinomyces sp. ICM39 TaxID=1105029 RepID=UPI000277066C|nr:restriction endonuclease subunit S [Actinomyces sp. ICM39]EJN46847.1 type I restriction modification DNA specificity domain protein [Actinomyces sp. ICM39]
MSRLAELIEELCPDGVEYKPIGSFAQCVAGATPNSKDPSLWDGNIPWMSSGEVNKRIIRSTDRCITQRGFDSCSTKMIPAGAVVVALAGQGKTRGTVARTRIELCTNQSLCAIISDANVDSDFLFHYLVSQYNNLRAVSSGDGTRGGLNLKMIREYRVPVPPVEIQREIVRILDQFTTLEAELEAELEVRRAQYEHYRTHLLSYESLAARGQVRWCALGDVVRICNGRDYKTLSAGDVPVYGSGGVMTYVSDYLSVGPTVLIPRKGSLDNIYFVEGQFWTVDTIFYTEIGDALHPKFFFHYMKQMKLSRMNEAAGVPSMTQRKLSSIRIPIPSYEEQRRIADLLDRFDALVNDISSGLPAEIAARRAQYEHYRDRLLSFPEKAASGDDAS